MDKKVCIITGANAGIGKAAALQIIQEGYHVILACRNEARGKEAFAEIMNKTASQAAELMIVDLSLQSSIRDFAKNFLLKYNSLDVLIHNAAAFDISQKEPRYNEEGIESIWATNHVGPVLLSDLLLEATKSSAQGRIITISSKGLIVYPRLQVDLDDPEFRNHKFSVSRAYYQSKLAQVMYTYWLADQLRETTVTVNCIRVTNVKVDVESRYPNLSRFSKFMYSMKSRSSITPEEMALTYTYLATSDEVKNTTGKYFDDPTSIVSSSNYSLDKQNIEDVMTITRQYIQNYQPEGEIVHATGSGV